MNKEKIAQLIYELRKEKGLTQKELAEKLFISEQAISKWERKICLPDLTTFKELAKIFDISVAELISGERIKNDNKLEQIDEIYLSNLQKEKKKNFFKTIIISFILIIFMGLSIFFFRNYQKIFVYEFTGNTLHYHLEGLAIFSDKDCLIRFNNFAKDYNFPFDDDLIKKASITIYIDEKEVFKSVYSSPKNFLKWLDEAFIEFKGNPNKNCQENCLGPNFYKINKKTFPKKIKVIMEYCDTDNCYEEEFKIDEKILASNGY